MLQKKKVVLIVKIIIKKKIKAKIKDVILDIILLFIQNLVRDEDKKSGWTLNVTAY